MMNKTIVHGVNKVLANDVAAQYGDDNLAVVVKNGDGKKIFLTPKLGGEKETVNLALTKRDLRELSKMVKDGDDEDCVEIKLLVMRTPDASAE